MKKKILFGIKFVLLFGFLYWHVLLLFAVNWLLKTWGLLTIDEVVFQLKASFDGTNSDMVQEFWLHHGLPAFLLAVVFYGIFWYLYRKYKEKRFWVYLGFFVFGFSLFGFAYHKLDMSMGVTHYLVQEFVPGAADDSTFIEDNYVDAGDVEITFPQKKRNLVYIYLESMEMTYADEASGGAFSENIIPELTELSMENENFSGENDSLNGAISLPGSTWTTGAMFAQSSGMPLKVPVASYQLDDANTLYPSLTTLGDILGENGYNQELMIGSDASFGGRSIYYTLHGNQKIFDYNYAIENGYIPADYNVWWGYEDEKLFEFAKEELLSMAEADEPFALSLLTVDTHFEDGYVCELCGDTYGDNQYANVMACSSRQVAEFVRWIQAQDFYEDTTIVINGDHPTMDTDFCTDVSGDYVRKTYSCVINSAAEATKEERTFSTMDLFPTTLAAMGCAIEGDQLGLGVNLYSSKETLLEQYGFSYMKQYLSDTSKFMYEMSGLSFGEDLIKQVQNTTELKLKDDEGNLYFWVKYIHKYFNVDDVDSVRIETEYVNDAGETVTGEYECELYVEDENNPNYYMVQVTTDIPYAYADRVSAKVYFSAGEYKDYLLIEHTPGE